MHDVTDTAFRQVVAACGKPDVFYTEFVSIDGLTSEKSRERLIEYYLRFSESERPIVAQIWGSDPKKFGEAARIVESLGYDGVDINMGCPDRKVVALGGGAAHIKNREHALLCITAVRNAVHIPVSVKTRIGFERPDLEWMEKLMNSGISALGVHLRTKTELSRVPAHWELAPKIAKIPGRERVVLMGNGDVKNLSEARKKSEESGFDGIMFGRGILGNPWLFSKSGKPEELDERLKVLKLHAEFFEKYFAGTKSFAMLKKHTRGYVGSFAGAKKIREQLMNAKNFDEFIEVVSRMSSCSAHPIVNL